MSREVCRNCGEFIDGPIRVVDVDGDAQPWCTNCAGERREREAEVRAEQGLGVYEGSGMGEPREDVYQSDKDGLWYWRKFGGNGEEDDRSTEGYSSKEHAQEGLDRVRERDAERQAEIDGEKAAAAAPGTVADQQTAPDGGQAFDPGQSTPVDDVDAAGLNDQAAEVDPDGESASAGGY